MDPFTNNESRQENLHGGDYKPSLVRIYLNRIKDFGQRSGSITEKSYCYILVIFIENQVNIPYNV